jgi:hypothetical protein
MSKGNLSHVQGLLWSRPYQEAFLLGLMALSHAPPPTLVAALLGDHPIGFHGVKDKKISFIKLFLLFFLAKLCHSMLALGPVRRSL